MKEYETLKVYGKVLNRWTVEDETGRKHTVQVEVAYKEYDCSGALIAKGTEDFSPERYYSLRFCRLFGWDGVKRNRGGFRWFTPLGCATINRKDTGKLRHIATINHRDYPVIDLR